MRLHHLKLTAYGPFPGTVSIDFDDLNREGLFLLNGPTGSGKSSILDAICFALYGRTSSGRSDLKSRFADPTTTPEVELTCSIGANRYRIVRNPEFTRPGKRKNSGLQKEHAKVLIQTLDQASGEPTDAPAITRIDDAAAFMMAAIGLNAAQFNQVMLLPQGQFQQFLTASSTDREKLLRQLFGAADYQRIEETLKEHARKASSTAAEAAIKLDADMNRVQRAMATAPLERTRELLGQPHPTDPTIYPGDSVPEKTQETPEQLLESARSFSTDLTELLTQLDSALNQHTGLLDQLTHQTRQLSQEIEAWQEYQKLTALHATLQAQTETINQQDLALARHREAAQIRPYITHLSRAETALAEARQRAGQARTAVADAITSAQANLTDQALEAGLLADAATLIQGELTESALSSFTQRANAATQDLATFQRDELTLAATRTKLQKAQEDLVQATTKLTAAQETQHTLEKQLEADRAAYEQVEQAPARYEAAETALAAAQKAVAEAKKLTQARTTAETTARAAQEAEENRRQATHHHETLLRQRFDNAAHTLALALVPGEPCAVCGSPEHPNPASHTGREVTDQEIENAQKARDAAEQAASTALAQHATARGALTQLIENQTPEPDTAQAGLTAAEATLKEAQAALTQRQKQATRIKETEKKLRQATDTLNSRHQDISACQSQITTYNSTIETLQEVLEPQHQQLPFDQRISQLNQISRQLSHVLSTQAEHDRLTAQEATARQELDTHLSESTFTTPAEVTDAILPQPTATAYENAITDHREQILSLETLLAEEAMVRISELHQAGETAPDRTELDQLKTQQAKASQHRDQLLTHTTRLTATSEELTASIAALTATHQKQQHLIEDAHLKTQLSDVANGLSTDNRLRMTLSTYVLAFQLSEVAEAASEHLQRMTHGRYRLEHTDESDGRNRKSGLGLNVFDAWHNASRKPDSLSGGETFMASLALALGLADVVQQNHGGIDIDTLFVDEGFGSLDDETLEEVMATIDGLREGGRVIGLISHVAEMKNRITKHVQLATTPQGSHLITDQGAQ